MPAAVCPSFHWVPSTASTFLLPSASMRQMPTTLRKDFGSLPTVSSEKSTLSACPALAHSSNATSPSPTMAVALVHVLIFMMSLHLVRGTLGFVAAGTPTTTPKRLRAGALRRTKAAQCVHPRRADSPGTPRQRPALESAVLPARK